MIRKIFKLDEPLSCSRFTVYLFMIIVLAQIIFFVSKHYFENADRLSLILLMVLIVFSARRLKDIEANQLFAGLPLVPLFFWIFTSVDVVLIPFPYFSYITVLVYALFFGIFPMIGFLCWKDGISNNVFSKKRKGIMRKNTLIITIYILTVVSIATGAIFVTEYQLYSSRKVAMKIVAAVDKFETEKGYYPEKLEELVPNYIDKIPNNHGRFLVSEDFFYNAKNKVEGVKKPFYCLFIDSKILYVDIFCSSKRVWRND